MTFRRRLAGSMFSGLIAAATMIGLSSSASADEVAVYQHSSFSGYSAVWTYWSGTRINDFGANGGQTYRLYGPRTSINADNTISSIRNWGNRSVRFYTGTYQSGVHFELPPWVQSSLVAHNDQYSSMQAF